MNTWAPLWSPIVDSSLWEEDGDVVKVFVTLLATKDSDHVCRLDPYRMAKKCNFRMPDGSVDEVKVLDILKLLASPDKRRRIKQEFDGRRIKAVEDGWLVLNGEKYREAIRKIKRKQQQADNQRAYRERQKLRGKPLPGEAAALAAEARGDRNGADAITSAALPEEGKPCPSALSS